MKPDPVPTSHAVAADQDDQELLAAVLDHAVQLAFAPGESILSPETVADAFYHVNRGSVEVSYTDAHDTRITVALIGEGEFFGEIGFFDGESRVRDIKAAEGAKIAMFNQRVMAELQAADPQLYMRFLNSITRKICHKFRRIAGEREPLAGYAESLSSRRSGRYAQSRPLPVSLMHSELWHGVSSRMEGFKAELFNLSHELQQKEALGEEDPECEARCYQVLTRLNQTLPLFQKSMAGSGYEQVMWGYVFKEIFPYFMRSRFAERAYFKPKGYAGDFLMMEHIYADQPAGEGTLGMIIDRFCLQRPGSLAIRGRRRLLAAELARLSGERAALGKSTKIMNLACGPNRELFDFLAACDYSELVEALCVDIDSDALRYTNQHVNVFPHRASVRLMSENVIKWSLGRVRHHIEPQDIIYSAGLCDYLEPRLFRALVSQCHRHLKPGGTLLLGNFAFYDDSLFLDKLLRWELIYRSAEELRELFAPTPFGDQVTILAERQDVNLFAMARKE
ncbi:cyclic nucleotide-binding domain-containing protein [Desulfogranum mediterraneum]|uniref:cyclic nucleotide-binding domain-containing protein n=1 Tax=Desulfogranum mediterraneum TaxID=160661 RepID=UPI00040EBDB3|nr:cyclic nucleotide-binding domain-containing protein [Desulfogranum mediterraneum]